ncbi:class I SAM-dependent methyltransferase [Nonomuraea jiangxiensis]|uniref:Ubiquinone/menaquinone biosynthesis C-methylase UbiE n=1 Tax=Nonomuraea jiangxiensis TaxID=633440 RepID=A0A1G8A098_9ACTN|nr:class I SAM-dependent methyltransferase [Nonomuraea jiangxiensis]SDH14374.1 Ubiquinone/menaquinone biosynthesis C-methylase UbiE [Nonomuraea jiangxiensis]
MPTISQEHPQPTPPHKARQIAESFGIDAERYDRARPPYPEALVRRIMAAAPGRDVVDVGCGTGIEARQFLAAGCAVLGVEPDARMAEFARRSGVEVEVATFESWEAAGRTFDAVVAGQSWHWVDPVTGAAKAARVLRPGGLLAAFAHVYDAPPPIAEALADAMRRVVPDSPFGSGPPRPAQEVYQQMFATFADGIRQAGAFGEPELWRFDWERHYTRAEWLDLLPTTGGLTRLTPDQLAEVLEAVGAAVDAAGGGFTMPYTTLAVIASLTPSAG